MVQAKAFPFGERVFGTSSRARDDHKLLFIIKCGVLSRVGSVYISVAYCRADLIALRHETAFDSL